MANSLENESWALMLKAVWCMGARLRNMQRKGGGRVQQVIIFN